MYAYIYIKICIEIEREREREHTESPTTHLSFFFALCHFLRFSTKEIYFSVDLSTLLSASPFCAHFSRVCTYKMLYIWNMHKIAGE